MVFMLLKPIQECLQWKLSTLSLIIGLLSTIHIQIQAKINIHTAWT